MKRARSACDHRRVARWVIFCNCTAQMVLRLRLTEAKAEGEEK